MEHIIASIVKEISDFMKDFGLITGFLLVVLESGFEYYDPHVREDRKYIFNSLVYSLILLLN